MYYYEVAPNQIIRAGQPSLTYSSSTPLSIGQVVRVPVGQKTVTGLIISSIHKPQYEVKEIATIIEEIPLPPPLVQLALWLSEYYLTPLANVIQTILPRGVEKTRRSRKSHSETRSRNRTNFVFNKEQSAAIASINKAPSGTSILHGVTGSGKTAVYIQLAKEAIEAGNSVLILVPEIALTSQLVDEFSQHFPDILLSHSRQTEAERHLVWREVLNSASPRVAIGPRSALFLPLSSIGLVVIDESHEPSYKQEQSPKYHAARAASMLCLQHNAKLVLGSATPSVQDYFVATATNKPIARMTHPAAKQYRAPSVELIDMTKRAKFKRHRFLSDTLLAQLEKDFEQGKQAMIFHNRRGSTSVTLCENCGWQAGCPRCFIPLTLHADAHELRCHICGLKSQVPTSCPECQHANIIHKGIGTKLIESELKKLFPSVRMSRFDGDTSSDDTVEARYNELYSGDIQLIIGTQVIAKGLDLPQLHTVGIVQADAGLSLPDFSSSERTFQLLAQAVGRVGRTAHQTHVVVQSYQPTHPIVQYGLSQNYEGMYQRVLSERKQGHFPPYCYLLQLVCSYKTEATAIKNSQELRDKLQHILPPDVQILGPTPTFYERMRDTYRWQLIIKSSQREHLLEAVRHMPPKNWYFELDPINLL